MTKTDLIYRYKKIAPLGASCEEQRRFLRLRKPMFEFIKELASKGDSLELPASSCCTPREIQELAEAVSEKRPRSNTLIDQCPLSDRDLARRVQLILDKEKPLQSKRILFVGDDDLASVLLSKVSNPRLITVVDIDERILNTIEASNTSEATPLETVKANIIYAAEGKIVDKLKDRFYDVFVTDPPYTEMGYRYFLAYALHHLKLSGRGFIAVPHMALEQWTDELLFKVERFLLDLGCVVEDIVPASAMYEHEEGVVSSTLVVKKVSVGTQAIGSLNPDRVYTLGTKLIEAGL